MYRLLLIAAALPFLSGCISNPGNYYSYEGGGDYYYEDAGADIIYDSYSPAYGMGYGGGFGLGYGYGGYGYGLGYGYGGYYGGFYGGFGYPWGYYGYSPIWLKPPTVVVVDSPRLRTSAEAARAERVALSHRPDGAYPESATWARRDHASTGGSRAALANWGARRGTTPAAGASRAPAAQRAPASSSRTAPMPSRSVSRPASRPPSSSRPMRSAPSPRTSSRKH